MTCPTCHNNGYTGHAGDPDPRPCEQCNNWRAHALCKGMTRLFFGETLTDQARARRICNICPVLTDCHNDAMRLTTVFSRQLTLQGIWAGTTPSQRIKQARNAL